VKFGNVVGRELVERARRADAVVEAVGRSPRDRGDRLPCRRVITGLGTRYVQDYVDGSSGDL
jgi:5,10-methylene-tetrahydrofolate dehydrogenase/methenyl tetrahydrofolate cyclohydrolase